MTVQIELSPEMERQLRQQAAAEGKDPTRIIQEALEERLGLGDEEAVDKPKLTLAQWEAEWMAWAEGHPAIGHDVDDSRESIYEGRGE